MIQDIKTVMWKEWREYLSGSGSKRRGNLGVIVFVLIVGILVPITVKDVNFTDSALPIALYAMYLPIFVIINVVADAFAGERERHTLETLLASRIPDRAILWGKIASAVSYGWGLGLISALLGLITTNLTHGNGTLRLYPLGVVASIVLLGLLMSLLTSAAGCLLSLRASSVRQVQQMLGVGVMCVVLLVALLLAKLSQTDNPPSATQIGLILGAVLLVLDAILVSLAMARFRRSRLILS